MAINTQRSAGVLRRLLSRLAMLGALFCGLTARADEPGFTPPGDGFSIALPSAPGFSRPMDNADATGRQWVLRVGGYTYVVNHSAAVDPTKQAYTDATVEKDFNDFVSGSKATVIERHNIRWPYKNGTLPALKFTFRLPNGKPGEAVFVCKPPGDRFGAAILNNTAEDRSDGMDAFINSLVVLK